MSLKQFTGDEAIPKEEQSAFQAKSSTRRSRAATSVIPAGVPRRA